MKAILRAATRSPHPCYQIDTQALPEAPTKQPTGCLRRLVRLDELQTRARAVNTALLDTERVGQGCVLASPAFERIAQPTLDEDGRKAPALRRALMTGAP